MTQKQPQPRLLKLTSGEQLIAYIHVQEDSDFLRLESPYSIQLTPFDMLGEYLMEEKMTMKPWIFKGADKIYSIHKNNVMTLAVPEDNLAEYYHNLITGQIKPLIEKNRQKLTDILDKMKDDEYMAEMDDYFAGKKTVH
tara:strand:+ start:230 stop:646 length:417 start_codon:yes stop_codon:yes gene_type:complete